MSRLVGHDGGGFLRTVSVFSLFSTHYFWLALGASALNSAVLAVSAGFAAKTDGGLLVVVLLLLTIASHVLSCLYFLSGRGVELLVHRFVDKRHLHPESHRFQKVTHYIEKYERRYIFMYRFIPGLRFISPYIMGMGEERFWPFFLLDWLAALLWASAFGVVGYLFGAAATRVIDDFAGYDTYIFSGIAALVVLYVVMKRFAGRHREEKREMTGA
jgi:membrane protein DedA with SNARE-associated domain